MGEAAPHSGLRSVSVASPIPAFPRRRGKEPLFSLPPKTLFRRERARRRQILLEDRHVEGVGDLALLVVAVEDADELLAEAHLDGLPFLLRPDDHDPVVVERATQIVLHPGNFVRRHQRLRVALRSLFRPRPEMTKPPGRQLSPRGAFGYGRRPFA